MDGFWLAQMLNVALLVAAVAGIWTAAAAAEKAAREAAQIKALLVSALAPPGFGEAGHIQRIAEATETLVSWEAEKRPPLAPAVD